MGDPAHFDDLAGAYGPARPPYPAALWRDVLATGLIAPGRRALDLGAGSGEATSELVRHGMDVVAVEPGPNLAALIEKQHPHVTVLRARAEDIHPDPKSFDLVVAATAIHWMDLTIVLPMIHRALTVDGRLLVWRNVFGDDAAEVTPFRRAVGRIVERRGDPMQARDAEDADATAAKIAASGLFSIDEVHRYRWAVTLTTEQVRALFRTFSNWTVGEVAEAALAVSALGGTVTEHYTSWLISASPRR